MIAAAVDSVRARKRIRDRNRRFRKLSPAAKRVRIAKDVIEQLESGRIAALKGQYFSPHDPEKWWQLQGETQLHVAIADQLQCSVCALGAAFVCAVNRANDIKVSQVSGMLSSITMTKRRIQDYLGSWFSLEQLGLIEVAFERGASFAHPGTDDELVRRAYGFNGDIWADSAVSFEERTRMAMVRIMRNIISNRGEFVP